MRITPLWNRHTWILAVIALCVAVVAPLRAMAQPSVETSAEEAILIDAETGAILMEKHADQRMPPASMTKMMTIHLVFERLKDGRLSLQDTFPVSEKAWKKGGSSMFVEVGDQVKVEDLIRGIIVQSGNDASIVVAEGLAGSESRFAELMNKKARELGMDKTHFVNSTGWPHPEHQTTAHDLAKLALATIRRFPQYYHYYSQTTFKYNDIEQHNRNPLLYKEDFGSDGLKTGHTSKAGYGLTASAERDGRRLVLVVNGLDSKRARAQEAERLLDWGFREFGNYTLFKAGQTVTRADVWLGARPRVPLVTKERVFLTLPRAARNEISAKAIYKGPIPAPVKKGQRLATLRIKAPEMAARTFPLAAGRAVGRLGFFGRLGAAARYIVFGASS